MNQTKENSKEPNFGPNWEPPASPPQFLFDFYLYYMLYIVASYHCMQFQGKLMNQTWENGEKELVSGLILAPLVQIWAPKNFFSWILPILDVRHHCKLSLHAISGKTNEIFSEIWLLQSLDIMVSYHHVQYLKKLMIQF